MNRVPVNEGPALGGGKLLHLIFEDAFNGAPILDAAVSRIAEYQKTPGADEKVVTIIEDLMEALPLWEDAFPVSEVLEVEQPFAFEDDVLPGVIWVGRPDRVVLSGSSIYHTQNRGLAASMNFGTYLRLAKRHYHEHLYARHLWKKYKGYKRKKRKYGGTTFNLVRKLKYRTNVGKKNEKVKTAAEMFYQQSVSYDLTSPLHTNVMMNIRQHVTEMQRVIRQWEDENIVPAPNEKMNGGYSGSSEDPYFKLLIGEITLEDDTIFKAREDMYASAFEEE